MSTSLLATITIVLSEVVILLLALTVFLLLRLRKHKSAREVIQAPLPEKKPATSEPTLQSYIEDQITNTTQQLEAIDETDDVNKKTALASRLGLLTTEKQLLDTIGLDSGQKDYWDTVAKYYLGEVASLDNEDDNSDKNAALLSRLKQLEIFKELFFNAQNKLKDSFDVINNMKNTISNMPSNEENSQIEEMVDKLSIDNISLHKQLDKANQQLKTILDDAIQSVDGSSEIISSDTDKSADIQSDEVNELKDENDFLASQIQSLLQQELAQTKALHERIKELEATQNENSAAAEKYNDLKEENEFLSTQIQFLLQQELETSKIHQERIRELETQLNQLQEKPEALNGKRSEPDEVMTNSHQADTADNDIETTVTDIVEDITDDIDPMTGK